MKKLLILALLTTPLFSGAETSYKVYPEWKPCAVAAEGVARINGGKDAAVRSLVQRMCGAKPLITNSELVSGKVWWRDWDREAFSSLIEDAEFNAEIKAILASNPKAYRMFQKSAFVPVFTTEDNIKSPLQPSGIDMGSKDYNLFAKPFLLAFQGDPEDKVVERSCWYFNPKNNAMAIALRKAAKGKTTAWEFANDGGKNILKEKEWQQCVAFLKKKPEQCSSWSAAFC